MEITFLSGFGMIVLFCFWLPEILPSQLVRRPSEFSPETSHRFGQAKLKRLPHVLAHVANQLSAFEWPSTESVMRQYKDLMHAWSRLSEADGVAKQVFPAPSQGHSDWEIWWKLSHTDSRVLPPGCEAAFTLFHFMGMVGVSEARAESIASSLKRYSPADRGCLSTDRIIEHNTATCWNERLDYRRFIPPEMLGGLFRWNAGG